MANMKVYDLNKYARYQKVVIGDTEYSIKGTTVKNFEWIAEKSKGLEDQTVADNIAYTKEFVLNASNIPVEILDDLQLEQLNALMMISQGMDPDEELETEGNAEVEMEKAEEE